jgi:pimeloyl-ACP methyl ester carboxylesterase
MGHTPAPASLRSANDVLDMLLDFVDQVAGSDDVLVIGHSAGAHYANGIAARRPDRVSGLGLVCPVLAGARDVPEHRAVVAEHGLGDEAFRSYFVVQTPAMLDRYERFVAPAIPLADQAAMERIGERWELDVTEGPAYQGPTLVVAGRQDSVVGYAAAADLLDHYPRATLAVLDDAGHALPHEQMTVLAALIDGWLARSARVASTRS